MAQGVENLADHYADLNDSETLILTTPYSDKVFQVWQNLKKSGVKLNELQASNGLHNLLVAVWKC